MKTYMPTTFRILSILFGCYLCCSQIAVANNTPQPLPYVQDWSNPGLITAENDWSGVPGIIGHRGDRLANKPGMNPQIITVDGATTPVDVIPNQKSPNTLRTGGVVEFDGIPDPTVALKGSGTASAPSLTLNLDTTGKQNIAVGYNLRDIDGSGNNAVQTVAFQYRVQTNANFVDIPGAFVPDASTGPSLATEMTHRVVLLPAEANNQPLVQVRWITCNAEGHDEWIGIDDIAVIGDDVAKPAAAAPIATAVSEEPPTPRQSKPLRSGKDPGAN